MSAPVSLETTFFKRWVGSMYAGVLATKLQRLTMYLIASDNAGRSVDDLLRDTFPGCKVVRFSPPGAPLQNWERVLKIVKEFFAGGKARVSNGLELLTRIGELAPQFRTVG